MTNTWHIYSITVIHCRQEQNCTNYKLSCNGVIKTCCRCTMLMVVFAVIFNYMRYYSHDGFFSRIFVMFCVRTKLEKILFRFNKKKCVLNRSLTLFLFLFNLFHSHLLARSLAFILLYVWDLSHDLNYIFHVMCVWVCVHYMFSFCHV